MPKPSITMTIFVTDCSYRFPSEGHVTQVYIKEKNYYDAQ